MPPPERFGRYEVVRELGRGGMAVVYLARDPRVGREVAIKVISADLAGDAEFRRRFDREAQALARLEHSAIAPLYDHGDEEGTPYLVFRYMEGGSLAERIARSGPLELEDLAAIARRVGAALDYAHERGVIHRDIKPANILFDGNGEAWLGDFGISLAAERTSSLTSGAWIGTPAYMSPEQANGDPATAASDIYSLGCTLFEAVTGSPPFAAEKPVALLLKHVQQKAPLASERRPDVPEAVARALARALTKKPRKRTATAEELARSISMVTNPASEADTLVTVTRRSRRPPADSKPTATVREPVERVRLPAPLGIPAGTKHYASILEFPWDKIDPNKCRWIRSGELYVLSCEVADGLARLTISRTALRHQIDIARSLSFSLPDEIKHLVIDILQKEEWAFKKTIDEINTAIRSGAMEATIDVVDDVKAQELTDALEIARRDRLRKYRELLVEDGVNFIWHIVPIIAVFTLIVSVLILSLTVDLRYSAVCFPLAVIALRLYLRAHEEIHPAIGWDRESRLQRKGLRRLRRRGFRPDGEFVKKWRGSPS